MRSIATNVFLSHSSRDESFLRRLKDLLVEKTNGTIRFFLSCDGQSIPSEARLRMLLDPTLFEMNIDIIAGYLKILHNMQTPKTYSLNVLLSVSIDYCRPVHKVLARLYQSGIELGKEGLFQLDLVSFKIVSAENQRLVGATIKSYGIANSSQVRIEIEYAGDDLANLDLFALLKILFDRQILFLRNGET